ncbi:hypothetical protein PTKIN_Ptkin12aG0145700 [Pterospermum kingtungense]
METNQFIIVLISLSCLFSLSASASISAPSPSALSEAPIGSPTSSPPSFGSDDQSFSFPGLLDKVDQTLSILPGNIDPGLQKICGNTDHPLECITTIVPFLDDKVAIEPVSILKVAIQAMNNKTREALAKAKMLSRDPSTPKEVSSSLKLCMESYHSILDSDRKVMEYIATHNAYMLSMELSSNVENIETCEDGFEEDGSECPIQDLNSLLAKMISNCLAIGVDLVRF